MKKIIALFLSILCISLVLPGMLASAANVEHIKNGDFESVTTKSKIPLKWSLTRGENGKEYNIVEDAERGGNVLSMTASGGPLACTQNLFDLVPEQTYTCTSFLKINSIGSHGVYIKMDFYAEIDGTSTHVGDNQQIYKNANGKWEKNSFTFTVPAGTVKTIFALRILDEKGEIYWDDVSIMGEGPEKAEEEEYIVLEGKGTEKEFLRNGDLEILGAEEFPSNWSVARGTIGNEFLGEKRKTHGGKNAIKMSSEGVHLYISQSIGSMVPEAEYTASAWVYPTSGNETFEIKIEMYSVSKDGKSTYLTPANQAFENLKPNTWNKLEMKFVSGENATKANCLFRMPSGGTAYFDDLSVWGEEGEMNTLEGPPKPSDSYVPLPEGSKELLGNLQFEELDSDGNLKDWTPIGGEWENNAYVSHTKEKAFSGEYSVKITTAEGNQPWVSYTFPAKDEIVVGATYQISYWVYVAQSDGSVGTKLEWSDEDNVYIGGIAPEKLDITTTNGSWQQHIQNFIPDVDCGYFKFYVRLYGRGEVYFDDPSFYMIKPAPKMVFDTNQVFFYTDAREGTATARPNTAIYPETVGSTVDFRILDGETVLAEQMGTAYKDDTATYVFDPRVMTELKKEYTLEATLRGADGQVLEVQTKNLIRYTRPSKMQADGTFIVDGEPFVPVPMYHVYIDQYPLVKEWGVNVVQGVSGDVTKIKNALDEAQKNGIKLMVPLYNNVKPIIDPSNIENTKEVVSTLKDHPALFAWMLMDEPTAHYPNQEYLWYESYKLIRELDDINPCYMVQANQLYVGEIQKYVDILAIDCYPLFHGRSRDYLSGFMTLGVETTNYAKPVLGILETFTLKNQMPTIEQFRNDYYRTMFAGAHGAGAYAFYKANGELSLNETTLWDGLVKFSEEEMKELHNHFVLDKYPVFKEDYGEDMYLSSYVKDGDVYVVMVNRKKEEATYTIPLVSDGGTVSIGKFSASPLYRDDKTVISGENELTVTLQGEDAVTYKLTPEAPVDFSGLHASKYKDLYTHTWAAEQIRTLKSLDIVNGITETSYAPGRNITRADFGMYLIRTLGLSADSTENFADVDAGEYYAKELAVGRALGIFQGVGDNKFNPNEEISRQDMMVICARGLRYVNKLSESGEMTQSFSDANLIADYAQKDVAAMVSEGIIKGNADGTVNPLGNATRAEAAVIMDRIYTK